MAVGLQDPYMSTACSYDVPILLDQVVILQRAPQRAPSSSRFPMTHKDRIAPAASAMIEIIAAVVIIWVTSKKSRYDSSRG